jgi:response regulator RpfG family c-di-GMP phosphodiesterase
MPKQYFHICNSTTPEKSGVKNVYSLKELQEIKEDTNTAYLINIHLNWNGNKLSNNYGFDIANEIRTQIKSKAPIVFYSSIQVEYFEQKSEKEVKYKILFGRGSVFIEGPFDDKSLNKLVESIEPLSNAALHDVVTMLCDLKGIVIEKINHDLKFGKDADTIIDTMRPYLSEKQKKLIELEAFVAEIKQINNEKDFNTAKQLFVEKCNYELTPDGENKPTGDKKKYKILIVDDIEEELKRAAEYLKNDFEVITASTGRKAIDILLGDTDNKILLVLSDWRLFTDENKNYWQPLQGYEVLEIAAKTGIRALFALTSQANFLIHQLRNVMGFHFPLFQKQNLTTEGQWKVMSDALIEACETTDKLINSQPTSDQWNSRIRKKKDLGISLKEIYALKRHTRDSFFSEIDNRANEIWQTYLDNSKNVRYKLGTLSTSLINEEVLKEVLVQRRVWIGLFLNYITPEKIYELMSRDPKKSATQSDITQLKIKLCIVEDDIKQKRFLPEEKACFKKWNLLD